MAGDDDNSADEDGEKGAAGEGNQEEEEVVTSPVAILSVNCSADNSLVISGCADSTAKVFNVSSGKVCLCVVFSLWDFSSFLLYVGVMDYFILALVAFFLGLINNSSVSY